MNKQELLELVDSLDLPKSEYYILGSGSLVLFGLRDKATDLDLCVSRELFQSLKEEYKLDRYKLKDDGFFKLAENIDLIPSDKDLFSMEFHDGYPVEKLETILWFKKERQALKDRNDIEQIEHYLEAHR